MPIVSPICLPVAAYCFAHHPALCCLLLCPSLCTLMLYCFDCRCPAAHWLFVILLCCLLCWAASCQLIRQRFVFCLPSSVLLAPFSYPAVCVAYPFCLPSSVCCLDLLSTHQWTASPCCLPSSVLLAPFVCKPLPLCCHCPVPRLPLPQEDSI